MDNESNKFQYFRKEFAQKWKLLLIISCGILLVFIILLFVVNANIVEIRRILKNVIADNNGNKAIIEASAQNLLLMSYDTNEVRKYLGFPQKEYTFINDTAQDNTTDTENDDSLIYKGLEKIFENFNKEKNQIKIKDFITNAELLKLIKDNGLELKQADIFSYSIVKQTNQYFTIRLLESVSTIEIKDFFGKQIEVDKFDSKATTFIGSGIEELLLHYTKFEDEKAALSKIIIESKLLDIFKEKKLTVSKSVEDNENYKYIISFNDKSFLSYGIAKSDLSYFVNTQKFSDLEKWKKSIIIEISKLNLKDDMVTQVQLSNEKLHAVFKDKAFLSLLNAKNLRINQKPREQNYFDYFDIMDNSGITIGSFAIDNYSGEIYIMDKDEIQISSIKAIGDIENFESKKKIEIPEFIPQINNISNTSDIFSFILCGSNETNTDTIIIVNINVKKMTITLFGIPRDLYNKGRRINTVYFQNGIESFMSELSQITGLKIEKYIHINMFAFIEVINVLGGIDITLDSDLIDPTYKVKDNGEWSTLYYEKGQHHLNGIQTLRIARSRHFSSDYDRSKRQQSILIAIKDKIKSIGLSNLDKVTTITSALLKYVKTNFTIFEIIQYFNKYKDYPTNSQYTLDNTNVLEATYSNIYLLTESDKEMLVNADFDKGNWILIPKNNDWNLIKWYIQQILS